MANTNDSCRGEAGKSTSSLEDPLKQQQHQDHREEKQQQEEHQHQDEGEIDPPETANTLALCPQCSFASRSPNEVDEHMVNVHQVALQSEWSRMADTSTQSLTCGPPDEEASSPLSTLVSFARSLPDTTSTFTPGIYPSHETGSDHSTNNDSGKCENNNSRNQSEVPSTSAMVDAESIPCSSRSLSHNLPVQTDSRRRYKCSRCASSFPWHGDLTDHMKEVHGVNKISRTSTRAANGARNSGGCSGSSSRNGRSAGTYSCPFCKYVAKYLSELRRHMRLHMGVKPFGCIFCPYKSAWKGDLKRHMESHHRDRIDTDEDLARIMARFKNNAGTAAIEPGEDVPAPSASTTPKTSPNPHKSLETPSILPRPPSCPSTDPSIASSSAETNGLLIGAFPLFTPTCQSLDPRLHPTLETLASIFASSPVPQPALLAAPPPPAPPPPPPPKDLLLAPPPPLPIFPPFGAVTGSSAMEGLGSLLSNCDWVRVLQNLTPEQVNAAPPQAGEETNDQAEQSSTATEEPLNLVCRPEFSTNFSATTATLSSEPRPPPAKRRSANPSGVGGCSSSREEQWKRYKCSSCGHRSNWKWDINKHIKVAHPEREDVTTITMDLDEARQSLPAYMERVRTYGRNGRPSGVVCTDNLNPSAPNGSNLAQPDREGYIRPFMCPLCGHRSNWKWDVRKHMKQMHGHEGEVITLSNEEARRTIDQYKSNRRQGQSLLRWSTLDAANGPSTSKHCYASDGSRDSSAPADSTPGAGSDGSVQSGESEEKTSSTFRCSFCKLTFHMWQNLAQHIALRHPDIGKSATAAAAATGNIFVTTSGSNSSSPLEVSQKRTSFSRDLTISPLKVSPWKREEYALATNPTEIGSSADKPADALLSTPKSSLSPSPSTESETLRERPKRRARRSLVPQVASSATQTSSTLQLSALENLLSDGAIDSLSTTVFQFAEMLKQVVTFLQSLLGEGDQESIESSNLQLISNTADHLLSCMEADENEPSTATDRSHRLAWLLLQPQVQSLADQLLPLIQRVKEKLNNPDSTDPHDPSQFSQP